MTRRRFPYAAEKLAAARATLMLPFPQGEAASIASAFHEIHLGTDGIPLDELDENARSWMRRLQELMNTEGIKDPHSRGTWTIKAEKLTMDEKTDLSRVVDELAHWFAREELRT